jgi:hypothetical protein
MLTLATETLRNGLLPLKFSNLARLVIPAFIAGNYEALFEL